MYKKQYGYKPGFVPVAMGRCLSFICPTHCCDDIAFYPPTMDEQPLNAGIHELATHRWCGALCHHSARWALTPPFHPYRYPSAWNCGGCSLSP